MPNMIGIKYVESLYVVQKRKKFNITAIAITTDGRKLASSMYATPGDIKRIHLAYLNGHEEEINTSISTGVFKLTKYSIPSNEYGIVPMYNVEIGDFKCKMSPSAYEQFVITLNTAYKNIMETKSIISIGSFVSKKKRKKGIFE